MIWSAINWGMHLSFWVALGLILASFVNNRRPARVHASGEVEFAPRSFGILAWIYVAVRMCFIAGDYLRHGLGEPFTFTTGALLGLASLLMIAALPGTVVVNDDGITEVFWFWRNKVVRWKEIVEINTEASGSAVRASAKLWMVSASRTTDPDMTTIATCTEAVTARTASEILRAVMPSRLVCRAVSTELTASWLCGRSTEATNACSPPWGSCSC